MKVWLSMECQGLLVERNMQERKKDEKIFNLLSIQSISGYIGKRRGRYF
jgi:hypothetical protein